MTASPPAPAAAQTKRNGCLIAAAVAGGILLLFVAVIGVGVVRFLGTKEGKNVVTTVGEAAKIAMQAQSAPGTGEIRKIGCAQAAVMDARGWVRLAALASQDASVSENQAPASVLVSCTGNVLRTPPTCDDVLHAYVVAVPPPPGRIFVQVRGPTDRHALCSNLYEADGTFVGTMELR